MEHTAVKVSGAELHRGREGRPPSPCCCGTDSTCLSQSPGPSQGRLPFYSNLSLVPPACGLHSGLPDFACHLARSAWSRRPSSLLLLPRASLLHTFPFLSADLVSPLITRALPRHLDNPFGSFSARDELPEVNSWASSPLCP